MTAYARARKVAAARRRLVEALELLDAVEQDLAAQLGPTAGELAERRQLVTAIGGLEVAIANTAQE